MIRRLVSLALIAALGGCSALATITISRSSPNASTCSTSPAPVALDFALATIGTAAAVGTGHVDAWLIIPGVFAVSGVVGTLTTYTCRHHDRTGPAEHANAPPPATPGDTPPPSTDAPVDPDARDATPGELGVTTEPVRPLPAPTSAPPVDPAACSIEPTIACPEGQSCLLEDGNRGHCVADH